MTKNEKLLNQQGFDSWAPSYEATVNKSKQTYPFAGYNDVLNYVYQSVEQKKGSKVLDIGVGTGLLTYRLYCAGAKIYGIDFSEEMLKFAKQKMPQACLVLGDFSQGLPQQLASTTYDYIVSSYALHHLTDQQKIALLQTLKSCLKPKGKIIIADVAFSTKAKLIACKNNNSKQWDESEFYIVAESFVQLLKANNITANYQQISSCAGVLIIYK